jgi:hypothetical protein
MKEKIVDEIEEIYEDDELDGSDKTEALADLAAIYKAEADRMRAALQRIVAFRENAYKRALAPGRHPKVEWQPVVEGI